MPTRARYGPAFCHPEKPAFTKAGFCQVCYQNQRRDRLEREALDEMDLNYTVHQAARERPPDEAPAQPWHEPITLAEAVTMVDYELVCALPEAARALRKQLHGKAQLKAAEILLSRFVVPTPDGPRRFLSDPGKAERVGSSTQVVIGLSVNPGGDGTVELGKVVGTVQPGLVGEKRADK